MRDGARVWLSLGAIATCWGSNYLMIRIASDGLGPFALTGARALLAIAFLWLALRWRGGSGGGDNGWRLPLIIGTFNGWLPNVLTAWAVTRIDTSLVGILGAANPIFTAVLAHFLLVEERLRGVNVAGVLLGFVGVVLIVGFDLTSAVGADLWGQLAALGLTLSYSIGTVYTRIVRPRDPLQLALRQNVVGGGVACAISLLIEATTIGYHPTGEAAVSLVALALLGTAVPAYLFLNLLRTTNVVVVTLVSYLIPVVALLLGVLLLGEPLRPAAVAGLLLVFVGAWLTRR